MPKTKPKNNKDGKTKKTFTVPNYLLDKFIEAIKEETGKEELERGDLSAHLRVAMALYISKNGKIEDADSPFKRRLLLITKELEKQPPEMTINQLKNFIKDTIKKYDPRTVNNYIKELARHNYIKSGNYQYNRGDFVFNNLLSGLDFDPTQPIEKEPQDNPEARAEARETLSRHKGESK